MRLPYGKRTGVEVVDTLTVIAHERFDELISKAKEENGVTRKLKAVTIGDGGDVPVAKPVVVPAPSVIEQMITQAAFPAVSPTAVADFANVSGTAPAATVSGFAAPPAPAFKYAKPEELNIAKTVLAVVLPQFGKEVSSIKDLQNPKVIERIASAAVAAQKFDDGLFPSVTLAQATAVAEEVCKQFVQRTIAIPTLTITPKQQVSFGFKSFDLDVKSWNYQPLSKELMIQVLRTEARSTISGEAGGERPERLEDYVVAKLIDFPEIDYESHAAILYGLAGQVVDHFKGKYADEEQVRTVLQGHAKPMADAIFVQMKQNMWREQTNYRVTVNAAFDHLKPQTFDGSSQDTVRDYRHPPERLQEIKRFIFGGFSKCCYQMAKFDSDTERKMSVLLEQDATVQLWMKPGPNQFKIFDADGLPYQPDFVVETDTDKLIIETKRASELDDPIVKRKADAASLWAFIATEVHGKKSGDKPWSYLLVPETAVIGSTTIKGLVASCQRQADVDLRTRYDVTGG